uniref:Uncharacterized protein n=1 Tax=Romanomermis culicivorax TaxID=13658 RepID=A0A915IJI7_ROMCU
METHVRRTRRRNPGCRPNILSGRYSRCDRRRRKMPSGQSMLPSCHLDLGIQTSLQRHRNSSTSLHFKFLWLTGKDTLNCA